MTKGSNIKRKPAALACALAACIALSLPAGAAAADLAAAPVPQQALSAQSAKASAEAGATRMPVGSTSEWRLRNCKLKVVSGKAVKAKGATVTAKRPGTAKVAAVSKSTGKRVLTKTVRVYAADGNIRYALSPASAAKKALSTSKSAKAPSVKSRKPARAQSFELVPQADGTCKVLSAASGKCLTVAGPGKWLAGARVTLAEADPADILQKWEVSVDSRNRLTFTNAASTHVLAAKGGKLVQQKAGASPSKAQRFRVAANEKRVSKTVRKPVYAITEKTVIAKPAWDEKVLVKKARTERVRKCEYPTIGILDYNSIDEWYRLYEPEKYKALMATEAGKDKEYLADVWVGTCWWRYDDPDVLYTSMEFTDLAAGIVDARNTETLTLPKFCKTMLPGSIPGKPDVVYSPDWFILIDYFRTSGFDTASMANVYAPYNRYSKSEIKAQLDEIAPVIREMCEGITPTGSYGGQHRSVWYGAYETLRYPAEYKTVHHAAKTKKVTEKVVKRYDKKTKYSWKLV